VIPLFFRLDLRLSIAGFLVSLPPGFLYPTFSHDLLFRRLPRGTVAVEKDFVEVVFPSLSRRERLISGGP